MKALYRVKDSRNKTVGFIVAKATYGGYFENLTTIPIYAIGARFPYETKATRK